MSESLADIRDVAFVEGQNSMAASIIRACMVQLDPNQQAAIVLQATEAALHSLARDLEVEFPADLHPADLVQRIRDSLR